jgi:hypothetical protein
MIVKPSQNNLLGLSCGAEFVFGAFFLSVWAISGRAFFGGNDLFGRT